MHDSALLVFLLAIAVLLGGARALGALAARAGFPTVVGEILAGVIIGKTVLGRLSPEAYEWLFGHAGARAMLEGYKVVAIVLLLTVAGLEIDTRALRRHGRALAVTCALSATIPFAAGYAAGAALPAEYLVDPSQRSFHAVFLGIALAISALPVIARTLMDLGLLGSQIGVLVLSAAVVDDLLGWICFGALVRELRGGDGSAATIAASIALTTGVLAAALLVLRPLMRAWLARIDRAGGARASGSALAAVAVLALLCAAMTEALGIHAVFGGFVVGLAIGQSPHLRAGTRHTLETCTTTLLTPVFFATMALRYDFAAAFDPALVVIVLVIAIAAKVAGSALGARLCGISPRRAWAIGFGLSSRGAMEILLASIALEAGMITEHMFVALVVMAAVTSMLAGPAMTWLLRGDPLAAALPATRGGLGAPPDRAPAPRAALAADSRPAGEPAPVALSHDRAEVPRSARARDHGP
jgi:Kef-type K+ transport system membrane component KefB